MNKQNGFLFLLVFNFFFFWASAQTAHQIPNASKVEVYKSVGDTELKAWIFNPPKHKVENKVPAIIFFFGGGWRKGSPNQFAKHCEYLAARGMVAITVDYRVFDRHGVKANSCVADAKSAIRWMRKNADRLGIDTNRIIASGGSAGGHLAASTATLPGHDDPSDDKSISAIPNAFALFNPAVILAQISQKQVLPEKALEKLQDRMGAPLESMSPYHHLKKGIGPTIIFHGTVDTTVPFETVRLYDEMMDKLGNKSILVAYEGEKHGFFNYQRNGNGSFIDTVNKLDEFLVDIGYLASPPSTKLY